MPKVKLIRILIIAIFVIFMLTMIPNLIVFVYGDDYVSRIYQVSTHQTAIVLGASVSDNGQPNEMLKDRLRTAFILYSAGKVEKLLLTGLQKEVKVMERYMLKHNVPKKDLIVDKRGISTYDGIYRAKKVYRIHDAIIISQKFHLARSLFIAKSIGMKDAQGFAADKQAYGVSEYVFTLREYLANVVAVLRVIIG